MLPHLPLVSAQMMAEIDQATIDVGTPGLELMNRAGIGVWTCAAERYELGPGKKVLFLCGKGNNGGDGFVAARSAKMDGLDTTVLVHTAEQEISGDALYHLEAAREAGVTILPVQRAEKLDRMLASADVVFDALLGTGLTGASRSPIDRTIRCLTQTAARIVAVDLPSGMNADTGLDEGVVADTTVTFGALKPAHVAQPSRSKCGALSVVDIGLCENAITARSSRHVSFGASDPALPVRARTVHKGDTGRVAIIAGSVGLTGAACLASLAALRSGAGLITLGLPETLNDIAEVKLTEVMTRPLPEVKKHRCLSLRACSEIRRLIDGADAIALGPGLGRHRETADLVRRLIHDLTAPTVLDADGLNAFEGQADLLRAASQPLILTPHAGEFKRLTGVKPTDPVSAAEMLASQTRAIVVLKGAPTIVALPDGKSFVNVSGNPGMATGGTGDVLAGILASQIAQGLDPENAALAGVYLHGLAGDLAMDKLGERGLIASDLVAALPEAEQLARTGEGIRRYVDYRQRV